MGSIKGKGTFGLNSKFTFLFHILKENYSQCNIIFKNRWQQIHDSKYLPHGYEKIELIRIVGNVYSHNFQEIKWNHGHYFLNQLMDNQVHTLLLINYQVALFLNFPKQQNLSVRQSQFQVEKEIFIFLLPHFIYSQSRHYTSK